MTSTSVRPPSSYNQQGRDPNTAAIMSLLLPGLGQMYNGETRKGMLFILVALMNLTLMLAMAFNEPILNGLLQFGQQFHMKPNKMLLTVLLEAHMGSPVSWILIGFFLSYVTYAVRDAYDHAALKRRRIYPDFVIELPEATSGSYIFHFSFMTALFIIAFFFIIPPMPKKQLTEIEFVDQQPKVEKRVISKRRQQHNSIDAGKHDPQKKVQAPQNAGQKQQQQEKKQEKQQEKQAPAQSAPKAPAPTPQPHAAPPTPKPPTPAPPTPRAATPAPPSPAPPMPRIAPMPTPRAATPSPMAPSPTPMRAPSPSPAMPRMAPSPVAMPSATPMPMAAAPKAFSSAIPMPSIAPAALPKAGTGAASPTPTARPAGGGGFEGLPSLTPTQIAMGSGGGAGGGSSNFAPLARSGGSQGGGSWSGPTAPGPVAAGGGGGGKRGGSGSGAPAPVAMSSGGGGGGSGSGSSGGSSGTPAPRKAGGGGQGGSGWSSGPISIMPSVPRGGSGGDGAAGNPGPNNNPNGKPSVAAQKDVDFGPYMADLQRRIKRAWFPPRGTESRRVMVQFKIHSGGELSDLRIEKSSGIALADQAALQAVQNAAPFRQLPDGAPSVVDIQFTFDYNVFSGGRSF